MLETLHEGYIRTARMIKRLYPHLKVYARARNRQHAFRLMDLGLEGITREQVMAFSTRREEVLAARRGHGLEAGIVAALENQKPPA